MMDSPKPLLTKFAQSKQACLNKNDLSLKGSVDKPIEPLVTLLNLSNNYYTSSSCSGRIAIVSKPHGKCNIKLGSKILLNYHEPLPKEELIDVLSKDHAPCYDRHGDTSETHTLEWCVWLKFEPFILHVFCSDLDNAKKLLEASVACGCRNSGLTLGKDGKYMVAIRSTSSMEVPLKQDLNFRLPKEYFEYVCDEANTRLESNFERLEKLYSHCVEILKS